MPFRFTRNQYRSTPYLNSIENNLKSRNMNIHEAIRICCKISKAILTKKRDKYLISLDRFNLNKS